MAFRILCSFGRIFIFTLWCCAAPSWSGSFIKSSVHLQSSLALQNHLRGATESLNQLAGCFQNLCFIVGCHWAWFLWPTRRGFGITLIFLSSLLVTEWSSCLCMLVSVRRLCSLCLCEGLLEESINLFLYQWFGSWGRMTASRPGSLCSRSATNAHTCSRNLARGNFTLKFGFLGTWLIFTSAAWERGRREGVWNCISYDSDLGRQRSSFQADLWMSVGWWRARIRLILYTWWLWAFWLVITVARDCRWGVDQIKRIWNSGWTAARFWLFSFGNESKIQCKIRS